MILTLVVVSSDLTPVRNQILVNAIMPSLDEMFTRLLCVSSFSVVTGSPIVGSFVLTSQYLNTARGEQGDCDGKGSRPKCSQCHQ